MTQLTVRGFDAELERRLRSLAKRNGLSLNQAALLLMRRGAGMSATPPEKTIGSALARFTGRADALDVAEIDQAIAQSRQADLDLQP